MSRSARDQEHGEYGNCHSSWEPANLFFSWPQGGPEEGSDLWQSHQRYQVRSKPLRKPQQATTGVRDIPGLLGLASPPGNLNLLRLSQPLIS